MTDLQRVSGPGWPFGARDRAIALLAAIGILAAIAKPWGVENGDQSPRLPEPSADVAATSSPVPLAGHAYDPKLFGPFEPAPDWSVWPAGYFVSVQYVTREAVDRRPSSPPAGASGAPSLPPPGSNGPDPSPVGSGPDWPAEIVVGPGDHLLWIGIDTPLGWTIRDAVLQRVSGGTLRAVPITRLPSEWDDHFAVYGIPVVASTDRLTEWPPGTYRLEVTVDPGRVTRTIRITIMTAPDSVSVPEVTTPP